MRKQPRSMQMRSHTKRWDPLNGGIPHFFDNEDESSKNGATVNERVENK
jgi:hypothetical protein